MAASDRHKLNDGLLLLFVFFSLLDPGQRFSVVLLLFFYINIYIYLL